MYMNRPLVSILINNFNYCQFLADAINSALNQSYQNIEVIVVDDGSTDNSPEIIARYGEKIVPVLKKNGGQASAFNAGFETSRGDIICFLDSDDLFDPEKVERIVSIFEENIAAGWVFHDLAYIDVKGMPTPYTEGNQMTCFRPGALLDLISATEQGKNTNYGAPATTALSLRRSLLQKIFPLPEALRITADECVKIPALCLARGVHLAETLASQRIHGQNAYTARTDNDVQRLEIKILTASFLREKILTAAPLADKMFVQNFGAMAGKSGLIYASRNAAAVSYLRKYGKKFSFTNLYRLAKSYLKQKCR